MGRDIWLITNPTIYILFHKTLSDVLAVVPIITATVADRLYCHRNTYGNQTLCPLGCLALSKTRQLTF